MTEYIVENISYFRCGIVLLCTTLVYFGVPLWFFSIALVLACILFDLTGIYLIPVISLLVLLNIPLIRQYLITFVVMKVLVALKFLPTISATEKAAIDAGTVWIEGELFSGKPNFKRILNENYPKLNLEEKAFLNGPVEELCKKIDDWHITQSKRIPDHIMSFLKKEGFFSLIIPKKYGGKGFSALANSAINVKINSKSSFIGIVVGVPNSLGPAELLVHYGTQAQKDYYLPRLASGEDLPCFALTETKAGSDAGSIQAQGVLFKDANFNLKVRLNFKKRYITLAPLATLIGLAFNLEDPEGLLENAAQGITCALVPSHLEGLTIKRHYPIGAAFPNGEIEAKDVIIPLDHIIGNESGIGKGWPMLMECLAAGRGITLPAASTAAVKMMMRISGAYAVSRKQFGLSIGHFEGIQEPLAHIAGMTYLLDATRIFTCGGIDSGAKPAVVTAMAKYHFTELSRSMVAHAADILAGAAVMCGPKNLVAVPYAAQPVGVTVEGANIMTRTLIIFGQGAIRCHPYALELIKGIDNNDLSQFDKGLFKHIGHIIKNLVRTIVGSLTRGYFISTPGSFVTKRYYQKLSWASSTFAILTDLALLSYGGALKRKGMLTGRYGDILSWMYMATCVLRRFEAEGRKKEDEVFMHWSMQYCFCQIQKGFEDVFTSLGALAAPVAFIQRLNRFGKRSKDGLVRKLAYAIQRPSAQRDRLSEGVFISNNPKDQAYIYDRVLTLSQLIKPIEKKIQFALKSKKLSRKEKDLVSKALEMKIISDEEASELSSYYELELNAVEVDAFSDEEFYKTF